MSSSSSRNVKLQSKIPNIFVQYATTDFEVRKTNLCWDIKEFGWTEVIHKNAKAVRFDKSVILTKHSCKCDLHLSTDSDPENQKGNDRTGLLKVRLHSYSGKGTTFFISLILRDNQTQDAKFEYGKRVWTVADSDEETVQFPLPAMKIQEKSSIPKFRDKCLRDYISSDGTLTIHVIFEEMVELEQNESPTLDSLGESSLNLRNFAELYEKKLLVDVTFTLPNKQELHAHSIVLAAVCPYFLSMFTSSNMKESQTRVVDLTGDKDVSFEIFKGFLDYIYGVRKLKEMEYIARGLAILAAKYDYSNLLKGSESVLCNTLDRSNLASLLLLSHQYNLNSLKQKALKFAKTYGINALRDLDGFAGVYGNPELLRELISSL